MRSVRTAEAGFSGDILRLGYKYGFLDDSDVWLEMLSGRNPAIHIYSSDDAVELISLIQGSFVYAFEKLKETLGIKFKEAFSL